MKILVALNHPAHVHYFKNFIRIMQKKGNDIIVVAQNKDITHRLLEFKNITLYEVELRANTTAKKILNFFYSTYIIFKISLKNKVDLLLGFGGGYITHVGKVLSIPSIVFDDTEHAVLSHKVFARYATAIISPSSYKKKIINSHFYFNGFMELCYLHPNYFTPDPSVLNMLGVIKGEKYIILRFVSWGASHDIGQTGLDYDTKIKLVEKLSKYARVFISSENFLPAKLKKYQINIPPVKMHDVLSFATLFIGEGATMASECAILGIPAIYINSLSAGTLEEQEKYGLLFCFRNSKGILEKAQQMLQTSNLKQDHQKQREKMLVDIIDVTGFMVWFIENYPECVEIMKNNPDYQYNFR